jgi:ADP-ribosylglycohydrolase
MFTNPWQKTVQAKKATMGASLKKAINNWNDSDSGTGEEIEVSENQPMQPLCTTLMDSRAM